MASEHYPPYPPFPPYPANAPIAPYAPYPPYPPYPPACPCPCPSAAATSAGSPTSSAPKAGTPGNVPPPSVPSPPVSPPPAVAPPHISRYDITAITLPPVANYHQGTGIHQWRKLVVNPATVPPPGMLQFVSANVRVTTLLFQINAPVVPNWFGVAVPSSVTDFSRPNLFFHPSPGQAGYLDADYPTKTGKWPQLFYYMDRLGSQVDAAIRYNGAASNQIIIMPFLTTAATNTGILLADWFGILTDILSETRYHVAGIGGAAVPLAEVVVSSFSVGLVYSDAFRQNATGLSPYLKQVWDFDGYPKSLSNALAGTSSRPVIKYDQGSEPASIHVPMSRWAAFPSVPPNPGDPNPPANGAAVHHLIRDFLFLHAATLR